MNTIKREKKLFVNDYTFTKETRKGRRKSDIESEQKLAYTVLYFRWIIASLMVLAPTLINPVKITIPILILMFLIILLNIFLTVYTIKNKISSTKVSIPVLFFDVVCVSILVFFTGGIKSDMYILLFILLGYCGVLQDNTHAYKFTGYVLSSYILAVMFYTKGDIKDFNFYILIFRIVYFVLVAFAVAKINTTVKKFTDMHQKEFVLARTDKLTGLLNRHYLEQRLVEDVKHNKENNGQINMIMFDLDNFKMFNDSCGHVWGDKLLVLFADIIEQNIRKSDVPVRYGGEEFLILIRDLDIHIVKSVAERIRKQLERQRLYIGSEDNRKRVTVSGGIAQFPKHSDNIKKVINYTDKALYYAKENGKNQIILYDEIKDEIKKT